ncbi:MAG: FG-GAP-like repeat-containing protein [Myxococcota bacterium]
MNPFCHIERVLLLVPMILATWAEISYAEPRFLHPVFGLDDDLPEVFGDLDGDGDLDGFRGNLFFENIGSRYHPDFAPPAENPHTGFSGLFDLDGDGDLDAIRGNEWLENVGTPEAADLVSGGFYPSRPRSLTLIFGGPRRPYLPGDIDADGDGDLLGGAGGATHYLRNDGASFTWQPLPGSPPTSEDIVPVAVADLDGDGDLDAVISDRGGIGLVRNQGNPQSPEFGSVIEPMGLSPFLTGFTDLDGDGDLDAIADDGFFENVGDARRPTFVRRRLNPFFLAAVNPVFVDLDSDDDLDLLLPTSVSSGVVRRVNSGTSRRPRFRHSRKKNDVGLGSTGRNTRIAVGDFDADGDPDAFAFWDGPGLSFFRNDGSARKPDFVGPVSISPSLPSGSPALADLDSDGDLDLAIGAGTASSILWRIGQPDAFQFAAEASLVLGGSPKFFDLDRDGDLDLFTVGPEGAVEYRPNSGSAEDPIFGALRIHPFGLRGETDGSIEVADIDGDGDADALLGQSFYENVPLDSLCPTEPAPECLTGFGRAKLTMLEERAGREKFQVRMSGGPTLPAGYLGNPLATEPTRHSICVYDHSGRLAIERQARRRCGSATCWSLLRNGGGYRFKDGAGAFDGADSITLRTNGASKVVWFDRNRGERGTPARHGRAAPALGDSATVTVQLHSSGGGCLSAVLARKGPRDTRTLRASN